MGVFVARRRRKGRKSVGVSSSTFYFLGDCGADLNGFICEVPEEVDGQRWEGGGGGRFQYRTLNFD